MAEHMSASCVPLIKLDQARFHWRRQAL